MSERYSRLFALPENLYASGAPVVIAAGALLKDNQTGKVLAQLKLRNIGNKAIKAATVSIVPFDTVGNPLGEAIQYQYLDLNAPRDHDFGSKSAISLPDITTRSFAATVTEIAFVDNSVWTVTESTWEPLSVPATISSIHGAEFAKQFCLEYGADCKNFPLSEKDLWHCACGALNHKEESHCHSCRKAFAAISSFNVDELNAKKNKRLADEKAKAEQKAEQARIKAEKNAKTAKKAAIIAACVVAVLLLLTKVIIPGIRYSEADKLVKAGQYAKAIIAYKAIDNSEETQKRIAAAHYAFGEELLAEAQYDKAVSQFRNAGDYKDARDRVVAAQEAKQEQINANEYNKAEGMLAIGAKVEAYKIFRTLGDYQDSTQRAEQLKKEIQQEISVQFVAFNTNRDDFYDTINTSIPRSSDYLHYVFEVNGSNPKESYTLRLRETLPGKDTALLANWTWNDVKVGDYKSGEWADGYKAKTSGKWIVEILIDGTDIVIGKFEMPVR